jgi:hypothetical protein
MSTNLKSIKVKGGKEPLLKQTTFCGKSMWDGKSGIRLCVSGELTFEDGELKSPQFVVSQEEARFVASLLTDLTPEDRENLSKELIVFAEGNQVECFDTDNCICGCLK